MTAFQITLIILAVVFLIIFTLLMLPIRLCLLIANGKAVFRIKLWLFTFFSTDKPKKEKKEKKKPSGTDKPKREKKKRSFSEILELVGKLKEALEKSAEGLKLLFSRFKIDIIRIDAVCAGDDAADTAMKYGIICSALYGLSGYLKTLDRLSRSKIDVNVACDFLKDKSEFEFELAASIKVHWATRHLLKIIFSSMNTITEVINSDKQ